MHYFPLWHKITTHLIICLMTFYFSIAFNLPCHWAVLVTGSHVGFEPQTVFADNVLLQQTAPPHPEAATLEPRLLAVGGLDLGCWTWRKLWFLVRVYPSTSWFTVNPPTPWATELEARVSSLMSLIALFLETLEKKTKVAEESWTTNLLHHSRPSISQILVALFQFAEGRQFFFSHSFHHWRGKVVY